MRIFRKPCILSEVSLVRGWCVLPRGWVLAAQRDVRFGVISLFRATSRYISKPKSQRNEHFSAHRGCFPFICDSYSTHENMENPVRLRHLGKIAGRCQIYANLCKSENCLFYTFKKEEYQDISSTDSLHTSRMIRQ